MNITVLNGGSSNVYGVFADGTQTTNRFKSSFNALQRSTFSVQSNSTGRVRAAYIGQVQFQIRDCVFYANATAPADDVGGVEVFSTTGFCNLKTSTISGNTFDIKQPLLLITDPSTIELNATDLQNALSVNGFTVNTEPSHFFYALASRQDFREAGSELATTAGTYYLHAGSQISNFSTMIVGNTFVQNVIVFEGAVYCNAAPPGTNSNITINLYKSSTPSSIASATLFATLSITNTTQVTKFQNKAQKFVPTVDFLIVQCIIGTNLVAGNDVCVVLGVY
jgi:hypothetical protein